MATRIGINGFGRMGRLLTRPLSAHAELELVHINEVHGGPETAAHLLAFDSVHGRWDRPVEVVGAGASAASGGNGAAPSAPAPALTIDGRAVTFSASPAPRPNPAGESPA